MNIPWVGLAVPCTPEPWLLASEAPVLEQFSQHLQLLAQWVATLPDFLRVHGLSIILWGTAFVATFMFLRMLFTRHGDSHITQKAMILSVMFHLVGSLGAMKMAGQSIVPQFLRELVDLGTDGKEDEQVEPVKQEEPVPIRGVILSSSNSDASESRPSKSFLTEALAQPEVEQSTRREQSPQDLESVPVPQKSQHQPEVQPVRLPQLSMQNDMSPETPTAHRVAAKSPRPVEGARVVIPEETSAAKPEESVELSPTSRLQRPNAGLESPQLMDRPTRKGADPRPDLPTEKAPTLADVAVIESPEATIVRKTDSDTVRKRPSPQPVAIDTEDPGLVQSTRTDSTDVGEGTPTSNTFSRLTRGNRAVEDVAAAQRFRPNRNPTTADPELGTVVASRIGDREPNLGGATPQLARSTDSSEGTRKNAPRLPPIYRLRGLPLEEKIKRGATKESEDAVERALLWLAKHQHPAGYWDADGFHANCPANSRCTGVAMLGRDPTDPTLNTPERRASGLEADVGVTALTILAFMGNKHTHEVGPYADNIDRALRWLIRQQSSDGFLGGKANRYARMYCHGMATFALAEARTLTKDPTLDAPLLLAVQYIVDTQHPDDGGWRYVKGQAGDMSMFGWQLMALKSAHHAGIEIPAETMTRCVAFLKKSGLGEHGGLAAYREGEPPKVSMTAEALYSRQMLGMKPNNPASLEAVRYLLQRPPRRTEYDLYYWYYGTLAMRQFGGKAWTEWNSFVQDVLVSDQRQDGHAAGSWDPRAPWGDFGGRIFSTAMSTLCLEVPYRFERTAEDSSGE